MARRERQRAAGALALMLLVLAACRREDPRIRQLTEQAAWADDAEAQLRQAWRVQFHRLRLARLAGSWTDEKPLALSAEQRRALERRVHQERDISRQGLLREILDKDRELKGLLDRLSALRAALPPPETAAPGDSHHGLALRFLRGRGLSDAAAREALSRVDLSARLLPGFEVYHFYESGAYGTWVSRGRAAISPRDYARMEDDPPVEARDEALAAGRRLREELRQLQTERRAIEAEVDDLRAEEARIRAGRADLLADHARQEARLQALHYRVGVREELERAGLIRCPLVGQDRQGPAWEDGAFTQSLDLRTGSRIVVRAPDLGLARIGRVTLVPGSVREGDHYRLTVSEDRQTATLELLNLARFRNDKLIVAVSE